MRLTLVQNLDSSTLYTVPKEYDREGVRISNVYVDSNKIPTANYITFGPRTVDIKLNVPLGTLVEADVDIIED